MKFAYTQSKTGSFFVSDHIKQTPKLFQIGTWCTNVTFEMSQIIRNSIHYSRNMTRNIQILTDSSNCHQLYCHWVQLKLGWHKRRVVKNRNPTQPPSPHVAVGPLSVISSMTFFVIKRRIKTIPTSAL